MAVHPWPALSRLPPPALRQPPLSHRPGHCSPWYRGDRSVCATDFLLQPTLATEGEARPLSGGITAALKPPAMKDLRQNALPAPAAAQAGTLTGRMK